MSLILLEKSRYNIRMARQLALVNHNGFFVSSNFLMGRNSRRREDPLCRSSSAYGCISCVAVGALEQLLLGLHSVFPSKEELASRVGFTSSLYRS